MQPAFDAWWGGSGGLYERRLGHDRAVTMNPLRILQDAGVALALGSDSPVTPMHPWAGVAAAVGHHNVGQQLSTAQAFAAHTVGGWAATGRDEAGRGSLVPGGYADLAVWSTAGVEAAIGAPDAVSCVLSVRAGRVLYDARTGSSAGA